MASDAIIATASKPGAPEAAGVNNRASKPIAMPDATQVATRHAVARRCARAQICCSTRTRNAGSKPAPAPSSATRKSMSCVIVVFAIIFTQHPPEPCPPAHDMRLYRANRQLQRLCGLLMAELRAKTERKRGALRFGQCLHRLAQRNLQVGVQPIRVCRGFGAESPADCAIV